MNGIFIELSLTFYIFKIGEISPVTNVSLMYAYCLLTVLWLY